MRRIPSLDGLRAISISLVIAGHFLSQRHAMSFLSVYSNTGVRVFFVISGYLITTLLLREQERTSTIGLREFYLRRAYQILPAAFVFLLPVLILYWRDLHWYQAMAALFYVVNFDYSRPWFIGHLWSLGVEEQFYLLWPSVLKKWYRYRIKVLLGVVALAPIYSALCFALKLRGGGYGTFPAVADNLAVGCLLAILAPRIPKISVALCSGMILAVALIPQFPANTPLRTLFMLFVLWPALHVCIAGILLRVVQSPPRMLNFAPLGFLGRISYSLYLWQQLFFSSPEPRPILVSLSCSLGLALLSYYLVEQPILRFRDGRPPESRVNQLCPAEAGG